MKLLLLCFVLSCASVLHAVKPELSDKATIVPVGDRLSKMIVPRIEFRETKVSEIITLLNRISKDLDPNKVGVLFELSPAAKGSMTSITLSLNKVPLDEVLKYVTNLANLKYEVSATKVVIKTIDEK